METASQEAKGMPELQEASAYSEIKHCNGCGLDLPFGAFSFDNSRKDGLNIRCRACVKRRWHEKNVATPCDGCGRPSMNGTCSECYRFDGLIFRLEEEIMLTIPRLLWHARVARNKVKRAAIARRQKRLAVVKEIASQEHLPPHERLRMLLEKIAKGGNKRNRKAKT